MYAPTLRKWCLMNILMYLWLTVLGLIFIWCQGTSAMHLTPSSPSSGSSSSSSSMNYVPLQFNNYNSYGVRPAKYKNGGRPSSETSDRTFEEDLSLAADVVRNERQPRRRSSSSSTSSSIMYKKLRPLTPLLKPPSDVERRKEKEEQAALEGDDDEKHSRLFYRTLFSHASSQPWNNNVKHYDNEFLINSNLSQKKSSSQLSVMFKLWERRRQIEALRKRFRVMPPSVQIQDTRQNARKHFGSSDSELVLSSAKAEYNKDLSPSPSYFIPARKKRDSRFPKFQPPLSQQPQSPPPPPLQSPTFHHTRQIFYQTASNLFPMTRTMDNSRATNNPPFHNNSPFQHQQLQSPQQQQQPQPPQEQPVRQQTPMLKGSHQHHHNNSTKNVNGGGAKARKYCSARDVANLAYEALVVYEGKVKSMNTDNYSVTFQVMRVHKRQPGFPQLPTHMRIHFKQVKSVECDLYREKYRNPGHVRGKLEQGKTYFIFGKFVELNNFTLIGQPLRNIEKNQKEVRYGLSENYGQRATIEKLFLKSRANRPVKLICKVNGRPPPSVTWYKNGQMISRNRIKYKFIHRKRQSQLIIKSYDLNDSGVYECRARNKGTKQPVSATIRVDMANYVTTTTNRSPIYNPSDRPINKEEDEPLLGAEECNPQQKESWCMNGGKCMFFSGVQEFSCSCAEGFAGKRCEMKTPTTYNQSSTEFGFRLRSPDSFSTHLTVDDSFESDDFDDYFF